MRGQLLLSLKRAKSVILPSKYCILRKNAVFTQNQRPLTRKISDFARKRKLRSNLTPTAASRPGVRETGPPTAVRVRSARIAAAIRAAVAATGAI